MILIEEIPLADAEEFFAKQIVYLTHDGIVTDQKDIDYFQSEQYRGVITAHMQREKDRHHMVWFRHNGERIGAAQYCTYQSEDGKCFVLDFWVFPAFRGGGCGHRCFQALEAYTRRDGAVYYEINCERENAERFWRDNGFEDDGFDEYDMKLMRKSP